ncbi:MAG: hypothetical protein K2Q26_02815 [Bdellovibrionales bacterium]|nr:hypothetical protein [Bdellovibrionales bacterium]
MKFCSKCNQRVSRECPMGLKRIVCKYIIRNGKVVYPTDKSCFAFCVPHDKA